VNTNRNKLDNAHALNIQHTASMSNALTAYSAKRQEIEKWLKNCNNLYTSLKDL